MAGWNNPQDSESNLDSILKSSHVEKIARRYSVTISLVGLLVTALVQAQWIVAVIVAGLLVVWGAHPYFHEIEIPHLLKAKRHPPSDKLSDLHTQPTPLGTANRRRRANGVSGGNNR